VTIARHKALSARGDVRRMNWIDEAIEFIEDPNDNPEVAMQKTERSAMLLDCLKQLSPAHREIIDLVYYHERSIADVAEIIGVPQNTSENAYGSMPQGNRQFDDRKRYRKCLAVVMAAYGEIFLTGNVRQ